MALIIKNNTDSIKRDQIGFLAPLSVQWSREDPNRDLVYIVPGLISTNDSSIMPTLNGTALDESTDTLEVKEGDTIYLKFRITDISIASAFFEISDISGGGGGGLTKLEEEEYLTGTYSDINCIVAYTGSDDDDNIKVDAETDLTQGSIPQIQANELKAFFYFEIASIYKDSKDNLQILNSSIDWDQESKFIRFNFTNINDFPSENAPAVFITQSISLI